MKHYDHDIALLALERWHGDASSLRHVATSGNAVYSFEHGGEPFILRLADPTFRSFEENVAEMIFLQHLQRHEARACAPVQSRSGALAERVGEPIACVLTWAPGVRVDGKSPYWNREFFVEWGRCLGSIHRAATSYEGPRRWEWNEEILIAEADELIPRDDAMAREEFELVMNHIGALPRTRELYGMTHGDFAPQNFNYDPALGITAFDFGNCCHHWFLSDIAISLSTLRYAPDRDAYYRWIIEGYREQMPLGEEMLSELSWFLRLRILYVYLSRLKKFGPRPSEEEREVLRQLRGRVEERFDW